MKWVSSEHVKRKNPEKIRVMVNKSWSNIALPQKKAGADPHVKITEKD
jgi:hypothetical protein